MLPKLRTLVLGLSGFAIVAANGAEPPHAEGRTVATVAAQCLLMANQAHARARHGQAAKARASKAHRLQPDDQLTQVTPWAMVFGKRVPTFQFASHGDPQIDPLLVVPLVPSSAGSTHGIEIPVVAGACVGQDYKVDPDGTITFIGTTVPAKPVFWFSLNNFHRTAWYQDSNSPPSDYALWLVDAGNAKNPVHPGPGDWPKSPTCGAPHTGISVPPITNPATPDTFMEFRTTCGPGTYSYSLHMQQSIQNSGNPTVRDAVELVLDPLLINHT